MDALTPGAWENVSTVTVIIILSLWLAVSLVRGWVVFGQHHRELLRLKDEAIAHARGRESEQDKIIATQADTIRGQMVTGEISAHWLEVLESLQRKDSGE